MDWLKILGVPIGAAIGGGAVTLWGHAPARAMPEVPEEEPRPMAVEKPFYTARLHFGTDEGSDLKSIFPTCTDEVHAPPLNDPAARKSLQLKFEGARPEELTVKGVEDLFRGRTLVAFVGKFKTGKTTLINCIFGNKSFKHSPVTYTRGFELFIPNEGKGSAIIMDTEGFSQPLTNEDPFMLRDFVMNLAIPNATVVVFVVGYIDLTDLQILDEIRQTMRGRVTQAGQIYVLHNLPSISAREDMDTYRSSVQKNLHLQQDHDATAQAFSGLRLKPNPENNFQEYHLFIGNKDHGDCNKPRPDMAPPEAKDIFDYIRDFTIKVKQSARELPPFTDMVLDALGGVSVKYHDWCAVCHQPGGAQPPDPPPVNPDAAAAAGPDAAAAAEPAAAHANPDPPPANPPANPAQLEEEEEPNGARFVVFNGRIKIQQSQADRSTFALQLPPFRYNHRQAIDLVGHQIYSGLMTRFVSDRRQLPEGSLLSELVHHSKEPQRLVKLIISSPGFILKDIKVVSAHPTNMVIIGERRLHDRQFPIVIREMLISPQPLVVRRHTLETCIKAADYDCQGNVVLTLFPNDNLGAAASPDATVFYPHDGKDVASDRWIDCLQALARKFDKVGAAQTSE
eukprot:m.175809 g.175809  ORF g.175809 m.175809 type:complete len:622 (+) comp9953_c0_seq3:96-1961(+)